MPTTVNTDVIIHNALFQTAYLERIQDVLAVFNQSSAGCLLLRNENIVGDFKRDAFYVVGGSVAHRNVNSTSTVSASKITADEDIGVKTPWKYGPYETTEEAFKRRGRSTDEFSMIIGQDAADAALAYMVEMALAALTGAIGSNAAMNATASFAVDGKKTLTRAMRKFGDRFNRIGLFAMHSEGYFDLIDSSIAEKVYEEAGLVIYGGQPGTMGKPVLVSDKVANDRMFALQPGAVTITESQPPGARSYNVDSQENLVIGYRAEGAFNVDVLGYRWDVDDSSAPANPNASQIATAANWAKVATSDKATAGVMVDLTQS